MLEQSKNQFKVTEDLWASQGQRFLNYVIDVSMQVILWMVVAEIYVQINPGSKDIVSFFKNLEKNEIALYTISFGVTLFYYNFFEILFSRTIGKFVTKTIVVDESGELPDHQVILIRSLCRLIPFFPFSFLSVPTLGWHDRISKTFVVKQQLLEQKKHLFYTSENKESELN